MARNYQVATEFTITDRATASLNRMSAAGRGLGGAWRNGVAQAQRQLDAFGQSIKTAGKMAVTYDKSAGSSGYVIRFGLKSDLSDAKVITVKGENTLSRTFSGMKKGKTYYVQARTYKLDHGIRYYSGYCTTKTITIRK